MTKKLTFTAVRHLIIGSVIAIAAVLLPLAPVTQAVDTGCGAATIENGVNCAQGTGTPTTLFGEGSIFTTIVNVLLFIIGAISVIMLIIGGIRYTISGGDSAAVTGAKNTIMYSLIGLAVAFLAFAIVNWVLGAITPA